MPNNAVKKMSKIKGVEKAHPHSRRAVQMRRALAREEKMSKIKVIKNHLHRAAVDRMIFFKFALPEDIKVATLELMHDLIDQYICRNDEEIAEMKEYVRPGALKPAKLIQLESQKEKDILEYSSGFSIPNMLEIKNVQRLRAFEGDYNGMGNISMTTLRSPVAVQKEKELKAEVAGLQEKRTDKNMFQAIVGMDTD
ncbi:hypothetical protein BC829DRAFT_385675 [Chytridium lagenaria]|nr:hypothetical protein BC829DRAFT_385675 [Chytridium lagenaria]